MKINRLAAIDIGSNSVRLLISDVINHEGKIIYKNSSHTRIPVKLGEDTFKLNYITAEKKEKLSLVMQAFRSMMLINEVDKWKACATSALREAENKNDIIKDIYSSSGIKIDIISAEEESHYIFLNCIKDELEDNRIYILADVGGGSTQLTLYLKNKQPVSRSFRLGTIRALDEKQELEIWEDMDSWINGHRNGTRNISLIGSGGNINKLNSLFRKRGKIKKYDFSAYYKKITNMNYEERIVNSELGLNRAEVIIPAMRIYLQMMKIIKVSEINVPMIGVADGIIKDLYLKSYIL